MIQKVIIANRGEIASRIIRTARRLGIHSVAVHSEADARAVHVGEADESFPVAPAAAHDTTLKIEQILLAARSTGADAVHPGYGVRPEGAAFARECRAAGLTYVGPATETIAVMGNKVEARALARRAGIEPVPGSGALASLSDARGQAAALGYPALLKPAAGGGGLGMQVVRDEADLARHFAAARKKAQRLFGDGTLYLEKLLVPARHVQVQLAGDGSGHLIHLGERECSVQLRHQKLVEESPAPGLDEDLRERLAAAALDVGRAARLTSIGSVGFLLAGGSFWFLEASTRLEVEHTVTEMVTGLDLVEWQLRLAMGEGLPARQQDIRLHGHAVQCRILAQDAARGYAPASGRIARFLVPRHPEVRNDVGVAQGEHVAPWYDPLIAKLVVRGPDRSTALARLGAALRDYQVEGLPTTLDLLRRIVADEAFVAGRLSTGLVAERLGLE